RQIGDQLLLTRRVERDSPADVLPDRPPDHDVVDPGEERGGRSTRAAGDQGDVRRGRRFLDGPQRGTQHDDVADVVEPQRGDGARLLPAANGRSPRCATEAVAARVALCTATDRRPRTAASTRAGGTGRRHSCPYGQTRL